MDKLNNDLSKRTVFLLSEFAIIVLGVLAALAVDSWIAARQYDEIREHLIASLLLDLKEDRADYEEFVTSLWWLSSLAPLRRDPRFVPMAERAGFVDFWRDHGWPDACRAEGDKILCE